MSERSWLWSKLRRSRILASELCKNLKSRCRPCIKLKKQLKTISSKFKVERLIEIQKWHSHQSSINPTLQIICSPGQSEFLLSKNWHVLSHMVFVVFAYIVERGNTWLNEFGCKMASTKSGNWAPISSPVGWKSGLNFRQNPSTTNRFVFWPDGIPTGKCPKAHRRGKNKNRCEKVASCIHWEVLQEHWNWIVSTHALQARLKMTSWGCSSQCQKLFSTVSDSFNPGSASHQKNFIKKGISNRPASSRRQKSSTWGAPGLPIPFKATGIASESHPRLQAWRPNWIIHWFKIWFSKTN